MPVVAVEGIIIRRSDFGEADRILTIITPFKGKVKIIAKGVRRITSRRGGNVELLNRAKLHIFQGKGMPILTEAEALDTFPCIKNNLLLSSYGSHIAELIDRFLPEEQANPAVYHLLASILKLLETNPRQIFIRAFEIKLLSLLGFWSLDQLGDIGGNRKILMDLQEKSWKDLEKLRLSKNQALEVEKIVRYHIEKILESTLKSAKMIRNLRENG